MFHSFSLTHFTQFLLVLLSFPALAQPIFKQSIDTNISKIRNSKPSFDPAILGPKGIRPFNENILSIFQDRNNNFWIGTDGNGVFRYDSNKILTHFTEQNGLSNNQVVTIQQDIYDHIWFSTGGFKVAVFNGEKCIDVSNANQLLLQNKWNIKKNDLFFPGGNGIFKYSPLKEGNLTDCRLFYMPFPEYILNSTTTAYYFPNRLTSHGVYSLLKDQLGHLWIGTQSNGVAYFNLDSIVWVKEKRLAGPAVLALFEDKMGSLWFGNNGGGLYQLETGAKPKMLISITEERGLGNIDFFVTGTPKENSLARIYSINQDKVGNVWVGTIDSGVWKYNPGTQNLTNYTTQHGLPSNAVTVIYKDKKEELWFGTTKGLFKFDGQLFQRVSLD